MNSEVLIIGGGVIGLSIARELHRKGTGRIAVLDQGMIGRESSFAAAGMLAPQAETDRPDDFFHLCDESNRLYPQFAEELLEETGIDIELDRSGTFYLAFDETDVEDIRRRFGWQSAAGLRVEHLTAPDLRRAEPFISPDVREGLFFPDDRQVENRLLLSALRRYAETFGIELRENIRVEKLLIDRGRIAGVKTDKGELRADRVILATGAWTSLIETDENFLARLEIKPIRGQMISFHTAKRLFTRVIYSPRGYLVPRRSGRILAGATAEDAGFDKRVTESGIDFVRGHALEISPGLVNLPTDETWAGLRPLAPLDALPVLGEMEEAKGLFIATAHYRNGILLAPLTAKIMADKIAENLNSKYLEVFGARRFKGSGRSAAGGE
ncbi:MAG: glycine oxidase ThiO [Pyrinomonadaceae bacterium]